MSRRRHGFTLPEVLIVTLLAALLLGVSATAVITLAKGSESLINYAEMNTQSRHALDTLGGLLRSASEVDAARGDYFEFDRLKEDGSEEHVILRFNSADKTLEASVGGTTRTLLRDVNTMAFNYFTFRQDSTSNPLEVKHVQLEAELTREVLTLTNRNYIISARYMLRNHRVNN
jgi:prepilin-type N-terminal cleavage/methylation domain-containing protein